MHLYKGYLKAKKESSHAICFNTVKFLEHKIIIMKKLHFSIIICLASVLLFCNACKKDTTTGALYVPSDSDVTANATLAELQQGRTLYMNNCGACHNLYSPDNYSPASWKSILPNMVSRTNLSQADAALVTKYVCKGKQ